MTPSRGLLLVLLLGVAASSASPVTPLTSSSSSSPILTWLPRALEPLQYRIRIRPILHEGNFTAPAEVVFSFTAKVTTRRIVLNVRDLSIDESATRLEEVTDPCEARKTIDVVNQTYDTELETFQVLVGQHLKTGGVQYQLTLRYVARIQDNLKGLYRTSYTDENNNTRWIAVTQLSPTNARALFPCMDEPQYKARFAISVARKAPYKSISNMPIQAIEPIEMEPDWVWDHFHTTVPMSTYLVAIAVLDYERLGGGGKGSDAPPPRLPAAAAGGHVNMTDVVHGVLSAGAGGVIAANDAIALGVWAPSGKLGRGAYAADFGPKVLSFFSELFDLPFPLPKQDMIMVPQFHFSAMENWGLIMYRESDLLVDPSRPESLHAVASTVAHELAHQWFGNLVTMRWWNDIWLNEGFATYMSQVCVSHLQPRWSSAEQQLFVVDNAKAVMRRDSTRKSHPVSHSIHKMSDIDLIFDTITYKKGSSLVRMMSDFLGERAFHKGLNAYLRKYRYRNAAQDDLWESLTAAARDEGVLLPQNETVKEVMDSWTLQTGFPVVSVTRDYDAGVTIATQERFLLRGSAGGQLDRSLWWVPLWVSTPGDGPAASSLHWLRGQRTSPLSGLTADDQQWILVNARQSGFYRVNYDERNWGLLTAALPSLPDLAQAGLADDALALADVGRLRYSVALGVLDRLPLDRASVAWLAATPWLRRLRHLTFAVPGEAGSLFGVWSRRTAAALYDVLPRYRNSSDPVENKFFVRVRAWACEMGVPACLSHVGDAHAERGGLVTELCSPLLQSRSDKEPLEREFLDNYGMYDYASFQGVLSCLENDTVSQRLLSSAVEKNSTKFSPSAVFVDMIKSPNTHAAAMAFLSDNWASQQLNLSSLERTGNVFRDEDLLVAARFAKTRDQYSLMERILSPMERRDALVALEQSRHNVWWMDTQLEQLISKSI